MTLKEAHKIYFEHLNFNKHSKEKFNIAEDIVKQRYKMITCFYSGLEKESSGSTVI